MKAWLITLDNKIIGREGFDKINDPTVFFDPMSCMIAKKTYFPENKYKVIVADVNFIVQREIIFNEN